MTADYVIQLKNTYLLANRILEMTSQPRQLAPFRKQKVFNYLWGSILIPFASVYRHGGSGKRLADPFRGRSGSTRRHHRQNHERSPRRAQAAGSYE